MHDLALLHPNRARVHLTSGLGSGGTVSADRHLHPSPLGPDDTTVIDGVAVTSLVRTAVDVATMGDFAQGLTVFDAALRAGAARDDLRASLADRRYGVRAARRALLCAHPGSESVGESWSRAKMIDAGDIPGACLQREFRCPEGKYRCDFCWEDKLIGEFDGKIKYGRLRREGESVTAVLREKRREDELRALGFMVVRWTWGMLERNEMLDVVRPWITRLGIKPTAPRAV